MSDSRLEKVLSDCREILDTKLDSSAIDKVMEAYHVALGRKGYDHVWKGRLEQILKVIKSGETDLSRVLAIIALASERERGWSFEPVTYISYNQRVQLPPTPAQKAYRGILVDSVLSCCTENTQAIFDMGSGWGEHLGLTWTSGGPADIPYFACEPEELGRKCALVLGTLESNFDLRAEYFNYQDPDFGFAPEGLEEAVVYSIHSIEQVPYLADNFIDAICSVAQRVKVVHLEPVGWQWFEEDEFNDFTEKFHKRCQSKNYNKNLRQLLEKAEAEGKIRINQASPNFFGLEYNPATLISWEKV